MNSSFKSWVLRLFELSLLTQVAVWAPLMDLLSGELVFFTAHRITAPDVFLILAAFCVFIPAVLAVLISVSEKFAGADVAQILRFGLIVCLSEIAHGSSS